MHPVPGHRATLQPQPPLLTQEEKEDKERVVALLKDIFEKEPARYCSFCGTQLLNSKQLYCSHCGGATTSIASPKPIVETTVAPSPRKSHVGKIVAVLVLVVAGYMYTKAHNLLSGTYLGVGGMAELKFDVANHYSFALPDQAPNIGTYVVDGDTITLDPTGGEAANDPVLATNPMYAILKEGFKGRVSFDRSRIDIAGVEFTKVQ